MQPSKLLPDSTFPKITVKSLDGSSLELTKIKNKDADWKMIIVYRGAHCPKCTEFLNEVEEFKYLLLDIGIEVVAVSADRKEQLATHLEKLNIGFDIGYGLTLHQMDDLGVYQSVPRNDHETDHVFAEPALFVIDRDRKIQVIELSNNPFVRPNINLLFEGLKWIRDPENNYPVRGTHYQPLED